MEQPNTIEVSEDDSKTLFEEGVAEIEKLHTYTPTAHLTLDTAKSFQRLTHVIMCCAHWLELYPDMLDIYAHKIRLAVQAIYLLGRLDLIAEQVMDRDPE